MSDFDCGHVPEFVAESTTAMDLIRSMDKSDWVAICTSERDDKTFESIAVVDGCKMLWFHNNPYSIRRLLQNKDVLKIIFNDSIGSSADYINVSSEISKRLQCRKPDSLQDAQTLLSLDVTTAEVCPQCRACIIHRLYSTLIHL
jgi:hypothetical protein